MKSLFEGTSFAKSELLMTDDAPAVDRRKKERDVSRRSDRNVKRWVVEAEPGAPRFDRGKGKVYRWRG
jgi:hypothetical protein